MKIAIIGSGVVGKATGKGLHAKGHELVFSDINDKILAPLAEQGFTVCHPDELSKHPADAYFFCVSTPTTDGHIKLEYLLSAVETFAKGVLKDATGFPLVVIRSTISPGTTEKKIIPLLEQASGKKALKDFAICMNPEFLREEFADTDALNPWIIVAGGGDKKSHDMLKAVYSPLTCPFYELAIAEAEMEKYTHNLFDSCKIAFFNEIRMVCQHVGINADNVFNAVKHSSQAFWDADYGTKNKGPFGGSCFPKDTQAFLYWATNDVKQSMPLLSGLIQSNEQMKKEWKADSAS